MPICQSATCGTTQVIHRELRCQKNRLRRPGSLASYLAQSSHILSGMYHIASLQTKKTESQVHTDITYRQHIPHAHMIAGQRAAFVRLARVITSEAVIGKGGEQSNFSCFFRGDVESSGLEEMLQGCRARLLAAPNSQRLTQQPKRWSLASLDQDRSPPEGLICVHLHML